MKFKKVEWSNLGEDEKIKKEGKIENQESLSVLLLPQNSK